MTTPESIPEPFVTDAEFWDVPARRYQWGTRNLPRAKNGSTCELLGFLECPECGSTMSSLYGLSSKTNGNGSPRKAPRKRYVYVRCPAANRKPATCANRSKVRAELLASLLLDTIDEMVSMTDAAIMAALVLRRSNTSPATLHAERKRLANVIATAENARHELTKLLASGALTQAEVETELFAHRRDRSAAETRLREVDTEMNRSHVKTDFDLARTTLTWLREHWPLLSVPERAEALRLLIDRATYAATGATVVAKVRVITWGRAVVEAPRSASIVKRKGRAL